ncbi:MAG TPA: glycerol-3-phosphate dehydrogenase/oxidase [Deltaproteobacteria bacterium]|nr:glycerol-3-phosphate dehydrogenase/oxidase [Deltaproteobacteria bacterium]HOI06931.1 glycerol-3-phosphate dehydrogenase/oxidase [Deltaproteobacteria bacterium]
MQRFIETHTDEQFDVVVIGGGITGATVAYDAASRGLKVALLEKRDFSGATSAATSKLIHGGLRYLANLEFSLVRESLRERKVLEDIAPNFVYPFPMLMTHYKLSLKKSKWAMKAGLTLYDILSYDRGATWDQSKKIPLHKTVSIEKAFEMQPSLKGQALTGASIFYDCMSIFPERLTLAFIKSAVAFGAKVANYARIDSFIMNGPDRVAGVKVTDVLTGRQVEVRGDVTINCGGPWADILLGLAKQGGTVNETLRRSEGIHIITAKKTSESSVLASMTPKGKHFFLIPWRGHTLIGTTDKEYVGSPDEYRVTKESIMELIADVNSTFGDGFVKFEDVIHTYGGLRPLVEEQTEGTYESSRKYEIFDNASEGLDGLITVEGGKYTTSRGLAQKVIDLVRDKVDKPMNLVITDRRYLYGCEIRNVNAFMESIKGKNPDVPEATLEYLGRHYGTEYGKVLEIARESGEFGEVVSTDGEILAEAVFAVRNEMARTLSDIVLRRTGIATLGNPGEDILRKVAAVAARELGWDDRKTEDELCRTAEELKIPGRD